jgi:hypothetical protein
MDRFRSHLSATGALLYPEGSSPAALAARASRLTAPLIPTSVLAAGNQILARGRAMNDFSPTYEGFDCAADGRPEALTSRVMAGAA